MEEEQSTTDHVFDDRLKAYMSLKKTVTGGGAAEDCEDSAADVGPRRLTVPVRLFDSYAPPNIILVQHIPYNWSFK
jgi:hypothetical protein